MSDSPNGNGAPPRDAPFLLNSRVALAAWMNTCPTATTAIARSPELNAWIIWPVKCRRWSCPFCARQKISILARRTGLAKPNRLLTLTVDPALHADPRAAFDATRRKVPELIKSLRIKFSPVDYLRVTEITKKGWPHFHLLMRSPYIPHACVKKRWQELTGATIVDLRQVKSTFNAYFYLVKYLSKLHNLGWTERHVSFTRSFFPEEPPPPKLDFTWEHVQHEGLHPVTWLSKYYAHRKLIRLTGSFMLLPEKPDDFTEESLPDADVLPVSLDTSICTAVQPKDLPNARQKELPGIGPTSPLHH